MQPSLSAGRCVRESHALIVSDWLILNLAVGPDEGMQTKAIPKLVCSIIMIWVSIDKTETVAICSFLLKSSLIEMKSGILADKHIPCILPFNTPIRKTGFCRERNPHAAKSPR